MSYVWIAYKLCLLGLIGNITFKMDDVFVINKTVAFFLFIANISLNV